MRNRQQIRTAMLALAQDALSPAEWEAERKAMVQWGLLTPDFRLKEFVLDLLTEQAAGYYDPKQRTFFIADWLPQLVQKPVMAHELVHALQDQHYDLQKNFDLVKDQADLSLARKALIEGDAMAVMLVYLLEPLGLTHGGLTRYGNAVTEQCRTPGGASFRSIRVRRSFCVNSSCFPMCTGWPSSKPPWRAAAGRSCNACISIPLCRRNRSCIRRNILLSHLCCRAR